MGQTLTPHPTFPPQHQDHQPGLEYLMNPRPVPLEGNYRPADKLLDKAAIISGGDSGIGRAVSLAFAKEGADVAIIYLNEHQDAEETKRLVTETGRRCLLLAGDAGDERFCREAVAKTVQAFGRLDIIINNAAEQHLQNSLLDISSGQLENTFRTNVFAAFYLAKAALPHLKAGATVINTVSVTAYEGHDRLIDYSASKGALVSFTRSLSESLCKLGIRVNGVAPGPVWTPLIPASFPAQDVATFGSTVPMGRAAQPAELAPVYVFLASGDSCYISGQIVHVNGGTIVES